VLASESTQPEVDRESLAVTHSAEIVIEPTGLLTLARLGRLSLLRRRFQKVYVAQHVMDDFFEARAKGEFGPSPSGWIGKVDGRYAVSDRPNEEYATDRKAILHDVVNFLITEATVVPCHLQLQYPRQQFDDFERTLGNGPIASIMVARELHLPLYSDDLMLRVIASNDWAVHSFWTQRLLVDARNRELLSAEEHFDAISELIRSHYHFVQIDVQYLLWLFSKHRLALSPEVMRSVGVLGDPACSLTSAVDVAADVVASCWANLLPDHFRHMVLDAVLGAVTQGRSSVMVLSAFRIAIGCRLRPRSRAFMEVQASLRLWERVLF
jgi:predicted nucleic acid-binding protein